MKYIVTGGCGFIGSHIVDRLLADGHQVTVIDNMTTGFPEYVSQHDGNSNFKLLKFDLKDLARVKEVFKGQDAVFHLAANADVRGGLEDNFRDLERNVLVTHNVLEAMRANDISKILFSSTAAVYGEPDDVFALVLFGKIDHRSSCFIMVSGERTLEIEPLQHHNFAPVV